MLNIWFKEYLVLGDLNAKTSTFNNKYNKNGHILDEVIINGNGQILNDKSDPTNFRFVEGKACHSVIDYAIGSNMFANTVNEYKTMRNTALSLYDRSYYHVPIKLVFNIARDIKVVRKSNNEAYIYTKANWSKFEEELDARIKSLKGSECIDELSDKIASGIRSAADISIPKAVKHGTHPIKYPAHIVHLFGLVKYWQRQHDKRKSENTKENLYSLKDCLANELVKFKSSQW
jgi:hypothetical protein